MECVPLLTRDGTGRTATTHNCEGFRLRVPWRGPSGLTPALSRLVRGTSRARTQVRKPQKRYPNPSGQREVRMDVDLWRPRP